MTNKRSYRLRDLAEIVETIEDVCDVEGLTCVEHMTVEVNGGTAYVKVDYDGVDLKSAMKAASEHRKTLIERVNTDLHPQLYVREDTDRGDDGWHDGNTVNMTYEIDLWDVGGADDGS